jgi:hypothetical protein
VSILPLAPSPPGSPYFGWIGERTRNPGGSSLMGGNEPPVRRLEVRLRRKARGGAAEGQRRAAEENRRGHEPGAHQQR